MPSSYQSSFTSLSHSPPSSPHSNDSNDSLRVLELAEGPIRVDLPSRGSYSFSGFDYQHELLPLSSSLSEPESLHDASAQKTLSLVNSTSLQKVFLLLTLIIFVGQPGVAL